MTVLGTLLVVVACALIVRFALYLWLPKRTRNAGIVEESAGPFVLPADFMWGAATADQQIEHAPPSNWTAFETSAHEEKRATRRADGAPTPGHIMEVHNVPASWLSKKTNFNDTFVDDIARAKAMGHNAHRFSVSWARLFPRARMVEPDADGVAFYDRLFDELDRQQIAPSVTLFHFASPQWLWTSTDGAGKTGLERDDIADHFAVFVEAVASRWGKRVVQWCTVNEPMVVLYFGYLEGVFPPNEQRGEPKHIVHIVENVLRCHARAYAICKTHSDAPVGIAHHVRHFVPFRNTFLLDAVTAAFVRKAFMTDFLDAIETGTLSMTSTGRKVAIPGLAKTQDYIGLNYYGRFYVKSTWVPGKFTILPHDPKEPDEQKSELGWAVDEQGFVDQLRFFHARYQKPIHILENGLACSEKDDRLRQDFLVRHIHAIWKARRAGVDVRSYFHWSLMDNFEWAEGFGPRFGLYETDYGDDFARHARGSVDVFRELTSTNGVSASLWAKHRR
jgi:beta-glucosidase